MKTLNWRQLHQLSCHVRHYPWGERRKPDGTPPFIADLVGIPTPAEQPFAELWIGAHKDMPSTVRLSGRTARLDDLIAANPVPLLGTRLAERGTTALPFLLKVLSCDRPLSIQAHPDTTLAATLHARDPDHYPDPNPKPEIAVALTEMNALCQFRPVADIAADVRARPPLARLLPSVPPDPAKTNDRWLRRAWRQVMEIDSSELRPTLDSLRDFVVSSNRTGSPADRCFLTLLDRSPGDRGTLSAYFLNQLHLSRDQAVFLAPGEPHAYLRGTIIECMANSDNVVRAGLTGKFTDTATLLDMLTYHDVMPRTLSGKTSFEGLLRYVPPVPEFQLELRRLSAGTIAEVASDGMISLFLITRGSVELRTPHSPPALAGRGTAWLWPAVLDAVEFYARDDTELFRAMPNLQ